MAEAAPPLADGRYRLIDVLAAGGMATVYKGYDCRLQVQRAIKILSPALARKRSLRTRFEQEASTMALLEHPSIVRVYDVGTDGDRVYIVMELIECGSLLDRVKEHGALPPKMAVMATIDMLDALRVAHDRGVVHRDIKPHNILLSSDGNIRLTDFGIARMCKWDEEDDGMTKTGAVMGTWGFMPPEQRVDAKSVDTRADLYSVGATLYSILTDKTPVDLFVADMDARILDGLQPQVAEVIRTACKYDREERYGSAEQMAQALRDLVDDLPADPEGCPPLAPEQELQPIDPDLLKGSGTGGTGLVPGTLAPADDDDAQPAVLATMVPDIAAEEPSRPPPPLPEERQQAPPLADAPDSGQSMIDEADDEPLPSVRQAPNVGLLVGGLIAIVGLGGGVWLAQQSEEAVVEDPIEDVLKDPIEDVVEDPIEDVVEQPPVEPIDVEDPPIAEVDEPPVEKVRAPPPVVKNTVKGLVHSAPASASAGQDLSLSVRLPSADYKVTLYYKPSGGQFKQKPLYGSGGRFSGTVPVDASYADKSFEYYIKADPTTGGDAFSFKSGFSPQKVPVR
ncbi:MAG TPA: protein kinase [Myxococcota bacterium]|nr:protein kinase [Myxococcota bacterium]